MSTRILGPTGSKRRRRFLLGPMLIAAVLAALFVAGAARAVHDQDFQLDGDVIASTTTSVGGSAQAFDWNSFFDSSGARSPVLPNASRPGFTNSGFNKDFQQNLNGSFNTGDHSTYATGSKDTLPISGWQCNFDNNVNSKIDVMNAYALAYTDPGADTQPNTPDDHQLLYFALERNANTGDANVAFWFLQGDVGCVSAGPSTTFSGEHHDGDLLVVSAFTSGGGVSTIDVYRWNGGANGSLGTTSVAHGKDCKDTLGGDSVCATTNSGPKAITGSIQTPWLTSNKQDGVGHTVRTAEFFEGGIDLTANQLGGLCFNVFIGDTRSSQSLTATLFDFARGQLGECTVSMTTTPSQSTRELGSTDPITDTADVLGHTSTGSTPPTPTGDVTFYLCSPSELTDSLGAADPDGTCNDSDGSQVGDPVTVSQKMAGSPPAPVPSTATATSDDAQSLISGLGKYCFRAHFDAAANDANYPGQSAETANATAECFTVTAVASISTAQSWLPQDTATVTGPTGATVAGYVVFELYESADCGGDVVQTFGDDAAARLTVDADGKATTDNTTYYTDVKTISWRATFTSTNDLGSGDASHCETMSVDTLNNDTGS